MTYSDSYGYQQAFTHYPESNAGDKHRLSPEQFQDALFHTGMSGIHGIPVQDLARLNRACRFISSNKIKNRIIEQLNVCDRAYSNMDMTREPKTMGTITQGDINRAEVRFDMQRSKPLYVEEYYSQCDVLCNILNVPNYWREEEARYRFDHAGLEFLALNDAYLVADTCITDKLNFADTISHGSGF